MKRMIYAIPVALLGITFLVINADVAGAVSAQSQVGGATAMSDQTQMIDLFDRWEKVWEGQYDLIPGCVGTTYTRHDVSNNRTVTREVYGAEIAKIREERPDVKVVVYDHSFEGDRAWFRFAFKWTDQKTHEARSQAGMQSYRTEGGKLVETWLSMQPIGSSWGDSAAQATWTSPPPIK